MGGCVLQGQSLDIRAKQHSLRSPGHLETLQPTKGGGTLPPLDFLPLRDDLPNYLTLLFTSRSFGQMCFPLIRVVGKILLHASYRTLVLLWPG